MSIKSQKCLYEECSEIIERSYSVRSASEESLSCDDEEESLTRTLLHKLTPAALSQLRRCFSKSRERSRARDIDRRVEEVMRLAAAEEGIEFAAAPRGAEDPLWLDEAGFVSAIEHIFGNRKYTSHAHQLFRLLDPLGAGRVRWARLVDRLVSAGARRTRSRAEEWAPAEQRPARRLPHCKRETIVKLVSIEREESFCYAAVSRGGRVGVYGGELQPLHSYEVFQHRTGVRRRVRNRWITDAIYLPDAQCLALCASDRSLTVYDAATLAHAPVYCVTGMPHIPTCMAYAPAQSGGGAAELALGSERGDVTRLRFLQPRLSLFHNKSSEHINYYFWMELCSAPHTSYCSVTTWRRVHARSVRRICYIKNGDIVLSCSHDSNVSVRARHGPGKLGDYVFKVQRGVSCFHVVPSLHVLATGGRDGAVRLWETTQSSPFATLEAPAPAPAPVLDVAVLASEQIVVAYCANCRLHIWDMYEECLLQTLRLQFPFLGVLGKKVEFGALCIHPGPARRLESEDEVPSEPLSPIGGPSRRSSSVRRGATGGLVLQPDDTEQRLAQDLEHDLEYIRFNRCSLLVTCCDYVCAVSLRAPAGRLLPPPGDSLSARRPSCWELPGDVFSALSLASPPPRSAAPAPLPREPLPPLLSAGASVPARPPTQPAPAQPTQDLEKLLENAGLQGILEKDFVLMQALKHDLNRKLAQMGADEEAIVAAVCAGGPHLALRVRAPAPPAAGAELRDRYARLMSLFPAPGTPGTRSASSSARGSRRPSHRF